MQFRVLFRVSSHVRYSGKTKPVSRHTRLAGVEVDSQMHSAMPFGGRQAGAI